MKISGIFSSAAFCVLLTIGCGRRDDRPPLVPVTGILTTSDGVPVSGVKIEFHPLVHGASSYGKTDDKGQFTLRYSTGPLGAAVGTHSVAIIASDADSAPGESTLGDHALGGEDATEGTLAASPLENPVAEIEPGIDEEITVTVVADSPNHLELTLPE